VPALEADQMPTWVTVVDAGMLKLSEPELETDPPDAAPQATAWRA
jgi:hypothetical protein